MTAPGKGYDRERPRTPSVVSRILLVRSKPGKQRGLGLKSRVFPAHLFIRLFSACHVSDGTDSRKTRPNRFRSGQDTSDQLLPPVDFTNFSCTRASLFRRLDRRYALADAENGSPYGDRAVHAADSRSVLRLDAIYDPLRPVGLGIGGALHPHRPEARRTSDTPVVHRVESPPSQVGRFGVRCTEDRFFHIVREDDAASTIRDAFHRSSIEASLPAVL